MVENIRKNMEAKTTEELQQIFEENDRNEYSDEAFEAIQWVLEERRENIISQQNQQLGKEKEIYIKYDPSVIRGFADELYRRANTIVIVNAAIFGLVGALVGGVVKGVGVAIIAALVAGGIGYYLGLQKAFLLKLQAQTALCQVKIEENTGKVA